MAIITIVGAGMMGSALCFPSTENGHEVRLVGTPLDRQIIENAIKTGEHLTLKRQLPESIKYFHIEQLEQALVGADLLISGVSSFGVDWFSKNVIPILPDGLPVLSVTKGMINYDGYLITFPEYYAIHHPDKHLSINAVGGPCTSYELADYDQTHVCYCGEDMDTLKKIKSYLETFCYHISLSKDVMGVECAVAIKNAYALAVSLTIGISQNKEGIDSKEHYNSQAGLFHQSICEMRRLINILGGRDENISWGAGDLYVTVFGGRTRKIGILLGRGLSYEKAIEELSGITLESIVISKRVAEFIRSQMQKKLVDKNDFPLLLHIDDLISNGHKVNIPWDSFTT